MQKYKKKANFPQNIYKFLKNYEQEKIFINN